MSNAIVQDTAPGVSSVGVDVGDGVAESTHVIDLAGTDSVAIVSRPAGATATATASTLVLIVVGGPQYRVGSHRQFVLLARALAAAGYPAMRFDVRGMGDAAGEQRAFTELDDDLCAALDAALALVPGIEKIVVWGLCDGASAALMHAQALRDPRVAGFVVANPWVRSTQSLARAHVRHYYLQRLRDPAFWRKLAGGRVGFEALRGLADNLRRARGATRGGTRSTPDAVAQTPVMRRRRPFTQRMAEAWSETSRPLLLLLSGRDLTAREFVETVGVDPDWKGALTRHGVERHDLPRADHTFSDAVQEADMQRLTIDWLERTFARAAAREHAGTTSEGSR